MNSEPLAVYYQATAEMTAHRLRAIEAMPPDVAYLNVELHALHVAKLVEAVAFAAHRVAEEAHVLPPNFRTKPPAQLLAALEAKGVLRLPSAQDISKSDVPGFAAIASGAGTRDLRVSELTRALAVATELLRGGHRVPADGEALRTTFEELRLWATRLRGWLWNHIQFVGDTAFLVQMGMLGTSSFFGTITKQPVN